MLVSVIIPCFNVEGYIEKCLDSVYSQTYSEIEVIAVDNNSQDQTYSRLVELKKVKYARLIILKEDKKGACAARNKGLSVAQGEWIQFLDADDLLKPEKIEHQLQVVNSVPTANVIMGASKFLDISGKELSRQIPSEKEVFLSVFIRQSGNTCSNFWSAELLRKIEGWNEDLTSSQETDLMFRLLLKGGNFVCDTEINTVIQDRETGRISQQNETLKWTNFLKIRLTFLDILRQEHQDIYQAYASDFYTFLVSTLFLLKRASSDEAKEFLEPIKVHTANLKEAFGVNKKHLVLHRLFGLKGLLLFV